MFKEKYLKYKTKYLELKSQLDGSPNTIQDGGSLFSFLSNLFAPSKATKATIAAREAAKEPNDKIKLIKLSKKTENHINLENGKLKVIDYLNNPLKYNSEKTIIINPEIEFYKENIFSPPYNDGKLNLITRDVIPITTDVFVILKNQLINDPAYTQTIGLIINPNKLTFFVIAWDNVSNFQCTEIDSHINYIKSLPSKYISNEKEILNECLDASLAYLSLHFPNSLMTGYLKEKKRKLNKISYNIW